MKGEIKTRKEIWCGKCNHWEYLEHIKGVFTTMEAKEKGWKKTHKYGWICPKCQKGG